MAAIQAIGETPPLEPRGAVPPPATCAPRIALWIATYAGFRSFVVYTEAVVGRSHLTWFGSFQISQRRTQGYWLAAAEANALKVALLVGA